MLSGVQPHWSQWECLTEKPPGEGLSNRGEGRGSVGWGLKKETDTQQVACNLNGEAFAPVY